MFAIELEIGDNLLVLLMAGIPTIPAIVAAIWGYKNRKELKPNGGDSVYDKVSSLHRVVVSQDRKDDESLHDPIVTIDKKGSTSGSKEEVSD